MDDYPEDLFVDHPCQSSSYSDDDRAVCPSDLELLMEALVATSVLSEGQVGASSKREYARALRMSSDGWTAVAADAFDRGQRNYQAAVA